MENLREKKQEKIDGKFYDMSPAADYRHSLVNGNIFYRLRGQFQDSLCAIFMENLDFCYCEDSEDYVIPDIMIICDRKNLKKGTYRGIPKFIVETLSPSTAFRDRTKKKEIYDGFSFQTRCLFSPPFLTTSSFHSPCPPKKTCVLASFAALALY